SYLLEHDKATCLPCNIIVCSLCPSDSCIRVKLVMEVRMSIWKYPVSKLEKHLIRIIINRFGCGYRLTCRFAQAINARRQYRYLVSLVKALVANAKPKYNRKLCD